MLRSYKNRKYINDSVVAFVGHYTDKQGNVQSRYMYIYEIHCIPTNQYYIGQHTCKPNCKDPLKEYYKGSGAVITKLRHQFEWYKDFTFTIIQFCKNNIELAEAELKWINHYLQNMHIQLINDHVYKQVIDYASHYIKEKKPVINLTTGETFDSQAAAALQYQVDPSSIIAAVKRKIKIGNCFWCLVENCQTETKRIELLQQYTNRLTVNEKLHCQKFNNAAKLRSSKIVVCVETGEQYSSLRELAVTLKVPNQTVQHACLVGLAVNGLHYKTIGDNNKRGKKSSLRIINLTTNEILENKIELAKRLQIKPSKVLTSINNMQPINGEYWIFETFLQHHSLDQLRNIVSRISNIRTHITTRTPLTFVDQNGVKFTIKQLAQKHKMAPSNILKYALWSLPLQNCVYTLIENPK